MITRVTGRSEEGLFNALTAKSAVTAKPFTPEKDITVFSSLNFFAASCIAAIVSAMVNDPQFSTTPTDVGLSSRALYVLSCRFRSKTLATRAFFVHCFRVFRVCLW